MESCRRVALVLIAGKECLTSWLTCVRGDRRCREHENAPHVSFGDEGPPWVAGEAMGSPLEQLVSPSLTERKKEKRRGEFLDSG